MKPQPGPRREVLGEVQRLGRFVGGWQEAEALSEAVIRKLPPRAQAWAAENAKAANADLAADLSKRLRELAEASRARKAKPRIENDEYIREQWAIARKLKRAYPRMTWDQVAARIPTSRSTLFRWRSRLEK